MIATRAPGRHFVHGLMVSMVNSIWVTAAHILLFDRYVANHPDEETKPSRSPWRPAPMDG